MRLFITLFVAIGLAGLGSLAQEKAKAPAKLTFQTKMGNVAFNHEEHVKRAGGDCKVCHDALWPQSKTAPLNFKAGMHKPAEAKHTSCGFCHHNGGKSFATQGNCNKCHVKKG